MKDENENKLDYETNQKSDLPPENISNDLDKNEPIQNDKAELDNIQEEKNQSKLQTANNNELQVSDIQNPTKHRKFYIENEKHRKHLKILLISVIVILVNLFIIFGIICVINKTNTNVYKNVYVLDQNVSNYTSDALVKLINDKTNDLENKVVINVLEGDKEIYNIKPDDIDFTVDADKTTDKVMAFGRNNNLLMNNIEILKALVDKKEIQPEFAYSEDKLDTIVKNIDLTIDNRYVDDAYSLDEVNNTLTITRGKTGNSIDDQQVKKDILDLLKKCTDTNYTLNIKQKSPALIDSNQIYNSVKRDPQDAYIDNTSTPPKFVSEKNGYDIDIQKLNEALSEEKNKVEGSSFEFPLTVIAPKVKLSDITYTLYNDKLAGYTTYFDSSQTSRAKNLEIALGYLNGAIVMPGQTFSYYDRVGEITADKGYLKAATFKGGTIVNETGGGVCQTSSTLYNVALLANMQIVERHQHGLPVGYVPPSRDATIYGNVLDFKFKNTRSYPVKIVTSFSESGNINISIYGTREKDEYDISLTSKVLYYIPYTTRYIYDPAIDSGVSTTITKGVNGYASESYITKKLNGNIVSSTLLSRDVYKAEQAVVKIGTKQASSNNVNIY